MAEILSSRSMTDWTNIFIWLWGIGGMVGALFIGHIIDHHLPTSKATLVLLVIMGIGFALMGYAPTPWAAAGCFIWGMCGWASMAPQQHALVSHAPRQAAASIAWNSSANYLGSGIGAALGSAALNAGIPTKWLPASAVTAVGLALILHLIKLVDTSTP
jgi:predicted MFS family arabinose efflux permease